MISICYAFKFDFKCSPLKRGCLRQNGVHCSITIYGLVTPYTVQRSESTLSQVVAWGLMLPKNTHFIFLGYTLGISWYEVYFKVIFSKQWTVPSVTNELKDTVYNYGMMEKCHMPSMIEADIDSWNGLLPDGTKPFPVLTFIKLNHSVNGFPLYYDLMVIRVFFSLQMPCSPSASVHQHIQSLLV